MANVNDDKKLKQTMAEEPVAKPILYGNLTDKNSTAANDLITQAWGTLQQVGASNPGAYDWNSDADYGMANDYLGQYQNRDPFSYDFNADALYQQYKDQYIKQGQMAMMDTMGQAAAMTGGYGNSYAQSVGQQAYNQYLGQLNEVMPELYGMAYDRYNQEGQEMLNMYDIYMGRANDNYGRHMDAVDLWKNDYDLAKDNYDTLYNEYVNAYNQKNTDYANLVNRITSTGYEPTVEELEGTGMSESEAKSLKNTYNTYMASQTKTEETKDPVYADFDYETQKKWEKEFASANTIGALERIGDRMEAAGINPKTVADWVDWYEKELFGKKAQQQPPDIPVGNGDFRWRQI